MRKITVRWLDHHESEGAWDGSGLVPYGAKLETRGWLIFENKEILEVTNTITLNDVIGSGEFGRPMRILKCAIYYRSDKKKKAKRCMNKT